MAGSGNHAWVGRDDMTELYFRDWDHLKACFGSEHVRKVVDPDGANFNDLETAIPLMVVEKPLSFNTGISSSSQPEEGNGTVAVLLVAVISKDSEEELERALSPALIKAFEIYAAGEVWSVQTNVGTPASQLDIRAYFGGKDMPEYPVTYKIYIKDSASVTAVRKAQKAFMEGMTGLVNAHNTSIAFGREGLVLDIGKGIKVREKTKRTNVC